MAPIFLAFMVWIKKEQTLEKCQPNISIIVAYLNNETFTSNTVFNELLQ